MKHATHFIAAIVISTFAFPASPSLTGVWTWGSVKSGGGTLKVIDKSGMLQFELECYRGGRGANTGNISGEVIIENDKGTFIPDDKDVQCEILFKMYRAQLFGPGISITQPGW